jgi:DNA-binding beta-propeller fold protein YncE
VKDVVRARLFAVALGAAIPVAMYAVGLAHPLALVRVSRALGAPAAVAPAAITPPTYEIDPFWPKELPNNWMFGNVIGLAVDAHDNVWVTHRPRSQPGAEKTPPVLELDPAGGVIKSWGGRDTIPEWGTQEHGMYVDNSGSIWVGFGGGLPYDVKTRATTDNANFLKLTPEGKVQLQIGKFGMGTEGSLSTKYLGNPTDVYVDPVTNEAFISDGYINRRIIVFDAKTGEFKRLWGAYGHKPDDSQPQNMQYRRDPNGTQPQQFNTPHCIVGSRDRLLYVCDRGNQRIQVFKHDGTFVKDVFIKGPVSGGPDEAPQDIAISTDPAQTFLFVIGGNERVYTLRRDTFEVVGSFGHRGRSAGQLIAGHSLAIDSKGNLYVGETLAGSRLQKFVPKKGAGRS